MLYSAIIYSRADSPRSCGMWFSIVPILVSTEVLYWQRYLLVAWLVLRETAAVSAQVMCTPLTHTPGRMPCVFSCNLPPELLDLLRAAAVTRGWDTYRMDTEKRVSIESWPWRRNILPPVLRGLEPESFWSQVRRLTTELSQLPNTAYATLTEYFSATCGETAIGYFGTSCYTFDKFEYTTCLCFWDVVTWFSNE